MALPFPLSVVCDKCVVNQVGADGDRKDWTAGMFDKVSLLYWMIRVSDAV